MVPKYSSKFYSMVVVAFSLSSLFFNVEGLGAVITTEDENHHLHHSPSSTGNSYLRKQQQQHEDENSGQDGGVLVLKTARSGSSWFAENLSKLKGLNVVEEGITHSTGSSYSKQQKEIYLLNGLRHHFPKIKLCAPKCTTKELPPSSSSSSSSSKKNLITMSPTSSMDLNFAKILRATHSKLVIYVRSNMVKMAIARIRGPLVVEACHGSHNIAKNRDGCKHKIPSSMNTPVSEIMKRIESEIMSVNVVHHALKIQKK
jgi:hypothetical protein